MKPYKGEIHNWKKVEGSALTSGPIKGQKHLNFLIYGLPKGHPEFESFIFTSAVVSYWEASRRRGDPRMIVIETLNSRYHLMGEGKGL